MNTRQFVAQIILASLGLAFLCQSAIAQRYDFMQDSVLYNFTSEEIISFRAFARTALDAVPDMAVMTWESPSGQKTGRLMARFTYRSDGTTCRRAAFQVGDERGRTENYRFDLCRQPDGWEVVEAPANLNATERREFEGFLDTVIESGEVGVPVTWIASSSGHSAVVVPLALLENDTSGCKNAAVTLIDVNGSSISGQYQFCHNADTGLWEFSQPIF